MNSGSNPASSRVSHEQHLSSVKQVFMNESITSFDLCLKLSEVEFLYSEAYVQAALSLIEILQNEVMSRYALMPT